MYNMRDPIRHAGLRDPGIKSGRIPMAGQFRLNQFKTATVSKPRVIQPHLREPGLRWEGRSKAPIKGLKGKENTIITPQSVSARAQARANFSFTNLNFNRNPKYNPYH